MTAHPRDVSHRWGLANALLVQQVRYMAALMVVYDTIVQTGDPDAATAARLLYCDVMRGTKAFSWHLAAWWF